LTAARRREDHEQRDPFVIVQEAVLNVLLDEDDAAGPDARNLTRDLDGAFAAEHVVDLILGVGALRVGLTGGQVVDAGAERRALQELVVGTSGCLELLQDIDQMKRVGHVRTLGTG
jgi:hypothetical protein